jgi:hypothetical protein
MGHFQISKSFQKHFSELRWHFCSAQKRAKTDDRMGALAWATYLKTF